MPLFPVGSSLATGACSNWVCGKLEMERDKTQEKFSINKGKNFISKFPSFSPQNRASLRCISYSPSGGPLRRSLGCQENQLLQLHTLCWLISPSILKVLLRISFLVCGLCLIAFIGFCFWGNANQERDPGLGGNIYSKKGIEGTWKRDKIKADGLLLVRCCMVHFSSRCPVTQRWHNCLWWHGLLLPIPMLIIFS